MRTANARLLIVAALVTPLAVSAIAMGPATARTAAPTSSSVTDKAGDVDKGEGADWFAPSVDIRKVTVTGQPAKKRVVVRVKFSDLRVLKRGDEMYKQDIFVSNRSGNYEQTVRLTRSPWGEGTTVTTIQGDGVLDACKGATWEIDVATDAVTLRMPSHCLDMGDLKSAKVAVSSGAYRTYMDADNWIAADAAKTTGAVRIR